MGHNVSGCKNCLFCDEEYTVCTHPSIKHKFESVYKYEQEDETSPEWCPLSKEPITIMAKQQKKKKPLIDDHSFVVGGRLPVVHSLNSNNLSKDGWGRDGNTYSKGGDIIVFDGIKYMLNGLVVQFMEDIKK